jgi:hypothetical protein
LNNKKKLLMWYKKWKSENILMSIVIEKCEEVRKKCMNSARALVWPVQSVAKQRHDLLSGSGKVGGFGCWLISPYCLFVLAITWIKIPLVIIIYAQLFGCAFTVRKVLNFCMLYTYRDCLVIVAFVRNHYFWAWWLVYVLFTYLFFQPCTPAEATVFSLSQSSGDHWFLDLF